MCVTKLPRPYIGSSRIQAAAVLSIQPTGVCSTLIWMSTLGTVWLGHTGLATAQAVPRRDVSYGVVEGLAVDSLHGGVLMGARILIEGTPRVGITDSAGRFMIDSVPPGSHRLLLMHPLLDTLGLSAVSPSILFTAGKRSGVVMAVPSARTVQLAKCGHAAAPANSAAVLGMVVTGDFEEPVEGAEIWLTWTELQVGEHVGVSHAFQQRRAKTGAGGKFIICGLPPDLNAEILAWHGPDTTAAIPVAFGQSFLTLLTLGLASDSEDHLHAGGGASPAAPMRRRQSVVHGLVSDVHGIAIQGATVSVDGAAPAAVTDSRGAFTLRDQPPGSHRLTFRGAGYDPVDIGINLKSSRLTEVRVTLSDFVPPPA